MNSYADRLASYFRPSRTSDPVRSAVDAVLNLLPAGLRPARRAGHFWDDWLPKRSPHDARLAEQREAIKARDRELDDLRRALDAEQKRSAALAEHVEEYEDDYQDRVASYRTDLVEAEREEDRRRGAGLKTAAGLLLAGAGLAYFLDPSRGRVRRDRVADAYAGLADRVRRAGDLALHAQDTYFVSLTRPSRTLVESAGGAALLGLGLARRGPLGYAAAGVGGLLLAQNLLARRRRAADDRPHLGAGTEAGNAGGRPDDLLRTPGVVAMTTSDVRTTGDVTTIPTGDAAATPMAGDELTRGYTPPPAGG